MNTQWAILTALLVALCLPQQPGKLGAELDRAATIFEKPLASNKKLIVQDGRTEVNFVRLNAGQSAAHSLPGSRQHQETAGKDAVQSPFGPGRVVERAGPLDAVAAGHILGPAANGDVGVQLSHVVKQKDGSPLITVYHLSFDPQGQTFWAPDSANVYAQGERPGIQQFNRQP